MSATRADADMGSQLRFLAAGTARLGYFRPHHRIEIENEAREPAGVSTLDEAVKIRS
jgi:hypothetical protein